jgi:hypothetical protein
MTFLLALTESAAANVFATHKMWIVADFFFVSG